MPDPAERRTPEQWLQHPDYTHTKILDCDGWTLDEWPQPITRAEFHRRLMQCTIGGIVPPAPDWFADPALEPGRETR